MRERKKRRREKRESEMKVCVLRRTKNERSKPGLHLTSEPIKDKENGASSSSARKDADLVRVGAHPDCVISRLQPAFPSNGRVGEIKWLRDLACLTPSLMPEVRQETNGGEGGVLSYIFTIYL